MSIQAAAMLAGSPAKQDVEDDAHRPDVSGARVGGAAENLRRDVARGTARARMRMAMLVSVVAHGSIRPHADGGHTATTCHV